MKKFFERYPWVQQAGCGVLICALLLSICLPLMGMRSVEPENPILDAAPQEITVLQAGRPAMPETAKPKAPAQPVQAAAQTAS